MTHRTEVLFDVLPNVGVQIQQIQLLHSVDHQISPRCIDGDELHIPSLHLMPNCFRRSPSLSGLQLVLMLLRHAGLQIYTACIDAEIDDKGFIVPGLGDAGDRAFGT